MNCLIIRRSIGLIKEGVSRKLAFVKSVGDSTANR